MMQLSEQFQKTDKQPDWTGKIEIHRDTLKESRERRLENQQNSELLFGIGLVRMATTTSMLVLIFL